VPSTGQRPFSTASLTPRFQTGVSFIPGIDQARTGTHADQQRNGYRSKVSEVARLPVGAFRRSHVVQMRHRRRGSARIGF